MVVHENCMTRDTETIYRNIELPSFTEEGRLELLLDLTPFVVLVRGTVERKVQVNYVLVEAAAVDGHFLFF